MVRRRSKQSSPLAGCLGLLLLVALPVGAIRSCISPDPSSSSAPAESTDPMVPMTDAPPLTPIPVPGSSAGGAPTPAVTANPADDARNDVTRIDCSWKTDSYNMTTATVNVRVVNHTDTAEFYSVDVGLSNAQGQPVATAYALAESIPPGGTVTVTGTTYPSGPVPGMRCQLANVTRIPMATGGTVTGGGAPDLGAPHVYVPHPDLDPFHIHLHFGHGHK